MESHPPTFGCLRARLLGFLASALDESPFIILASPAALWLLPENCLTFFSICHVQEEAHRMSS